MDTKRELPHEEQMRIYNRRLQENTPRGRELRNRKKRREWRGRVARNRQQ